MKITKPQTTHEKMIYSMYYCSAGSCFGSFSKSDYLREFPFLTSIELLRIKRKLEIILNNPIKDQGICDQYLYGSPNKTLVNNLSLVGISVKDWPLYSGDPIYFIPSPNPQEYSPKESFNKDAEENSYWTGLTGEFRRNFLRWALDSLGKSQHSLGESNE